MNGIRPEMTLTGRQDKTPETIKGHGAVRDVLAVSIGLTILSKRPRHNTNTSTAHSPGVMGQAFGIKLATPHANFGLCQKDRNESVYTVVA